MAIEKIKLRNVADFSIYIRFIVAISMKEIYKS